MEIYDKIQGIQRGIEIMMKKLEKFRRENAGLYWCIVVLTFITGLWPAGIFLIVTANLRTGDDMEEREQPYAPNQEVPFSQPEPPRTPGKNRNPKSMLRKTTGNLLIVAGGIFALAFFIAGIDQFLLWMPEYPLDAVRDSYVEFLFMGISLCVVLMGIIRNRRAERYRNYVAMLRGRDAAGFREIAKASSYSLRTVKGDLQDMVNAGIFGKDAWLDYTAGCLILTPEGRRAAEKRRMQEEEERKKKDRSRNPDDREQLKNEEILAEIRSLNEEIVNPAISDKTDRIERITRQIFEHQGDSPETDRKLRSFLDYYLPTTLKMLRTYRELEQQNIQGENINTTMRKIEEIMGKVAAGFEKQLDNLYQNDMLDITSDIAVMEQMMIRDGLSGGEGLKL